MALERGRQLEIVVSVSVVVFFVVLIIAIGQLFNTGEMSPTGGFALVAAIAVFVLAMAAAGVGLAYRLNDE